MNGASSAISAMSGRGLQVRRTSASATAISAELASARTTAGTTASPTARFAAILPASMASPASRSRTGPTLTRSRTAMAQALGSHRLATRASPWVIQIEP